MRARNSIFLLILLAAAMAYMSLSRLHEQRTSGIGKRKLFDIDSGGITSLEIEREGTKLAFNKKGGKWIIEHPLRDRADIHAVEGVIEKIKDMKWKGLLAPGERKSIPTAMASRIIGTSIRKASWRVTKICASFA